MKIHSKYYYVCFLLTVCFFIPPAAYGACPAGYTAAPGCTLSLVEEGTPCGSDGDVCETGPVTGAPAKWWHCAYQCTR